MQLEDAPPIVQQRIIDAMRLASFPAEWQVTKVWRDSSHGGQWWAEVAENGETVVTIGTWVDPE